MRESSLGVGQTISNERFRLAIGAVASAAAFLGAAFAPHTATAAPGTYTVLQCDALNRATPDAIFEDESGYWARNSCGGSQDDYGVKITNTGSVQHGRSGLARWSTRSPALGIVGVDVGAQLRRDRGHTSRLWMADRDLNEIASVGSGSGDASGWQHYAWNGDGQGARQFAASLSCERTEGCEQSELAKTWVRNLRLTVADFADPGFTALSGTLLGGGWIRGVQTLYAQAHDAGSGTELSEVSVNGAPLLSQSGSCDTVPGTPNAARVSVCEADLLLEANASTTQWPFRDGENGIVICVSDFAGNRTCDDRALRIDNTPPELAFASSQDPEDPELIRASVSDATSGVSSGQILYRSVGQANWRPLEAGVVGGELQARVDSTIDPPGEYEFMATATDVAGNASQTTLRADGEPMVLTFPLKSGVELQAHLAGGASTASIGYGKPTKVAGRIVDASGHPLQDQAITVVEHFGDGALIDRRVRTVQTDRDGHWGERLPAGPSRTVTATYAGNNRYLPGEDEAGRLRVRTKTTFRLSRHHVREGRRVVFHGKVAHLAARVPSGGKLIELEVKDGSRWHTVRHPFYTRYDGRYRLGYRFARFYTSDVAYRFRVRVLRERGWPYKAPVSSRIRKLVVKAH